MARMVNPAKIDEILGDQGKRAEAYRAYDEGRFSMGNDEARDFRRIYALCSADTTGSASLQIRFRRAATFSANSLFPSAK